MGRGEGADLVNSLAAHGQQVQVSPETRTIAEIKEDTIIMAKEANKQREKLTGSFLIIILKNDF